MTSSSSSGSGRSGDSSSSQSGSSTSNTSTGSERSGAPQGPSRNPAAPARDRRGRRQSLSPPKRRSQELRPPHDRSHSRERAGSHRHRHHEDNRRAQADQKRSRGRSRGYDSRSPPRHSREEKRRKVESSLSPSPPRRRSRGQEGRSPGLKDDERSHRHSSGHDRRDPADDADQDRRREGRNDRDDRGRHRREEPRRRMDDEGHGHRTASPSRSRREEGRGQRTQDTRDRAHHEEARPGRRERQPTEPAANGSSRPGAAREGRAKGGRASQFDLEDMPPPPPPPPPAGMALPPPPPPGGAAQQAPDGAPPGPPNPPAGPNYELSGMLAAETNKVAGVEIKYNEPPEARKPSLHWRLYIFKGDQALGDPLPLHRQSCYFFGKERRIVDVPTDHPSCSRQHAVLQYRLVEVEGMDGMMRQEVRPYLLDLGSTNGTFINNERIEAERFHELREQDLLKFGNSSRDYVLLHADSLA